MDQRKPAGGEEGNKDVNTSDHSDLFDAHVHMKITKVEEKINVQKVPQSVYDRKMADEAERERLRTEALKKKEKKLSDEEKVEIYTAAFLNEMKPVKADESEAVRKSYSDYDYGHYVLVFNNPDNKDLKIKPDEISLAQALQYFDSCLNVRKENDYDEHDISLEKEAFVRAFFQLRDINGKKLKPILVDAQEEKMKKQKGKKLFGSSPEPKKAPVSTNDVKLQLDTNGKSANPQEEGKTVIAPGQHVPLHVKNQRVFQDGAQQPMSNYVTVDPKAPAQGATAGGDHKKHTKDDLAKLVAPKQEQKKLRKIKLNKSDYAKVKRRYHNGGYLVCDLKGPVEFDWLYNGMAADDFLTLFRNAVIYKLTKVGLNVRSFLSLDATKIYVSVKIPENICYIQAEQDKLPKQLELGNCDLFSLEPCDSRLRPFRLKKFVSDSEKQYGAEDVKVKGEENASIEGLIKRKYQLVGKMSEASFKQTLLAKAQKVNERFSQIAEEMHCSFIGQGEEVPLDDIELD